MKKRSSEVGSGSFDLFLDTVCNTFGGIVFMAILLAVLIQTRAVLKTPETTEKTPLSAAELREILTQLDAATTHHAELAQSLAETPPVILSEDGQQYRDLVEQQQSLDAELAAKTQRQLAAAQRVAAQLTVNAELSTELEALPAAIKKTEGEVEAAKSRLAALVDSREATFRLPRVQSSRALSALVLVSNGQLFVARSTSGSDEDFNNAQVKVTKSFGGGFTLRPRQGTGWPIADPRVTSTIARARREGSDVIVAIWPDSYGEFAEIKARLIQDDVRYQLWPQTAGEVLTVSFGGGTSRVQ